MSPSMNVFCVTNTYLQRKSKIKLLLAIPSVHNIMLITNNLHSDKSTLSH